MDQTQRDEFNVWLTAPITGSRTVSPFTEEQESEAFMGLMGMVGKEAV